MTSRTLRRARAWIRKSLYFGVGIVLGSLAFGHPERVRGLPDQRSAHGTPHVLDCPVDCLLAARK